MLLQHITWHSESAAFNLEAAMTGVAERMSVGYVSYAQLLYFAFKRIEAPLDLLPVPPRAPLSDVVIQCLPTHILIIH
jgi:hypothetical protein